MTTKILTGHDAITYAEAAGLTLKKYADPIEGAREGLTVDEAREVAREDQGLIYLEALNGGGPAVPGPRHVVGDLVETLIATFDTDDDGTERHVQPGQIGRVVSADHYEQQGWTYGVVFGNGCWVHPDDHEIAACGMRLGDVPDRPLTRGDVLRLEASGPKADGAWRDEFELGAVVGELLGHEVHVVRRHTDYDVPRYYDVRVDIDDGDGLPYLEPTSYEARLRKMMDRRRDLHAEALAFLANYKDPADPDKEQALRIMHEAMSAGLLEELRVMQQALDALVRR